jgi:hypothetical protein
MARRVLLGAIVLVAVLATVATAAVRKPLMEEFTNYRCGPCADNDAWLRQFIANHPDNMSVVYYHMNWPGPLDPWWLDNPSENLSRRTYYGVSYVPQCQIDATEPGAPLYTVAELEAGYTAAAAVPCYLDIDLSGWWTPNSGYGGVDVTLTAEQALGAGMVLHVALVENDLFYDGIAAYDWHHYVMRDLLTNAGGVLLSPFSGPYPETRVLSYEWDASETWIVPYNDQNFRIVAWVQDQSAATQVVYQSEMVRVTNFTAIATPESVNSFALGGVGQNYPNPFNPTTHIPIHMNAAGQAVVQIFAADGALVQTLNAGELPAGTSTFTWDGLDFQRNAVASGVYYVRLNGDAVSGSRPITLLK